MSRDIDVHPHDHAPDQLEQTDWDVIVIGAGSTGENVAGRAAAGGLSVVIVERELVGGECSYWACTPSKSLLRPAEAVRAARAVDGAKQAVSGDVDADAVLARRDRNVHDYQDSGQVDWLDSAGVALVRGHARLVGERRVEVRGHDDVSAILTARHAVAFCTGSEASLPPIYGLRDVRPWTPRDATSARDLPRRLLVIGGGVVGCELATAYNDLGTSVVLVEEAKGLLANNEPEAGRRVEAALRKRGVDVRTDVGIITLTRAAVQVEARLHDGTTLHADEVLVAAGRRPRIHDLGVETIGLAPGKPFEVDDQLTVLGVDGHWLYAVGDCNGRALLTHQGKYQARACGDAIVARANGGLDTSDWSKHSATADHFAVPQVAFTDPQVAAVGLTVEKAREAGLRVRSVEYAIGDVAGAGEYADDYDGWACMVVDEDRRVVVGVTLVGPAVGELIHAATVAVVGEVPLERLWHAVPSYPTTSEIWLRLLEEYGL